jgi:hypothetical protein
VITKGNLKCDVGSKGLVLASEVVIFKAFSDLCPHTIVGVDEIGKAFGNLAY